MIYNISESQFWLYHKIFENFFQKNFSRGHCTEAGMKIELIVVANKGQRIIRKTLGPSLINHVDLMDRPFRTHENPPKVISFLSWG